MEDLLKATQLILSREEGPPTSGDPPPPRANKPMHMRKMQPREDERHASWWVAKSKATFSVRATSFSSLTAG